jgi:hypothetical protein
VSLQIVQASETLGSAYQIKTLCAIQWLWWTESHTLRPRRAFGGVIEVTYLSEIPKYTIRPTTYGYGSCKHYLNFTVNQS